jgi:hypothetical protein
MNFKTFISTEIKTTVFTLKNVRFATDDKDSKT